MAGIVSRLFGRDMPTADEYANAVGRGISPVGLFSGMVDMAALPFTLTGLLNPDQVVGGSKQMERFGALPPNPDGVGPETVEAVTSLFTPMGAARGLNKAFGIADAYAPGARSGAPAVQIPQAQKTENKKELAQMERMRASSKFAPRVREIDDRTSAAIQQEAERLTPTGKHLSDAKLGLKSQLAFRRYMKRKDDLFTTANKRDFDKALAGGRDHITIPPSDVATIELRDWIKDKMSLDGTTKDEKRAYLALYKDARKMLMGPMSLGVMKNRLAYNVRELADNPKVNSPFSKMNREWTNFAQKQVDKALKTRLEEAAITVPEAKDLVVARANYMKRRQELDKLKDFSLSKFFGNKEGQDLTPELIVNKLGSMTPTERKFFTDVADSVFPQLANQVRRTLFDKVVDAGVPKGQSTMTGFDQQKFLEAYDKLSPEMRDYITPKDPTAKAEWDDLILSAKQSLNRFYGGQERVGGGELIAEGLGSGSLGVRSTVARGVGSLFDYFRDRNSVFNRLYGNDRPPSEKPIRDALTPNTPPGPKRAAVAGLASDAARSQAGWHQSNIDDDDDPAVYEELGIAPEALQEPVAAPVGSTPSPGQENPLQAGSGPLNEVSVGDPAVDDDQSYLQGWADQSTEDDDESYLQGWAN